MAKRRTKVVVPATEPPTPEDVLIKRTCSRCENEIEVVVEGSMPAWLRELAERQAHGEGEMFCGLCGAEVEREEAVRVEEERVAEHFARRRHRAGLPAKWAEQTFVDLEDDELRAPARGDARAWSTGELRGLILWGPVGRGKTALAAAAANQRLLISPVRWLPVSELLLDLRMPFESREYQQAMRALVAGRGTALVLDDLDKMRATEHAVQPLYVAVNSWIEAELPLLVTLNRSLDELAEWLPETFGEAIASRLAGYCQQREVKGVDRRLS